jgi:hypothetical protein
MAPPHFPGGHSFGSSLAILSLWLLLLLLLLLLLWAFRFHGLYSTSCEHGIPLNIV